MTRNAWFALVIRQKESSLISGSCICKLALSVSLWTLRNRYWGSGFLIACTPVNPFNSVSQRVSTNQLLLVFGPCYSLLIELFHFPSTAENVEALNSSWKLSYIQWFISQRWFLVLNNFFHYPGRKISAFQNQGKKEKNQKELAMELGDGCAGMVFMWRKHKSLRHFRFFYLTFSNSGACCTNLWDTSPEVCMGTWPVCL